MKSKNSGTKNDSKGKSSDSWLAGYVVGGLVTAAFIGIAEGFLKTLFKKKD